MRSTLFFAFCFGMLLFFGACKKTVITVPNDLNEVQKALVKSDNELSFSVLRSLDASNSSTNIVLSPPALGSTMGMLISGADGDTRNAIQNAMGLNNLSTEDINQGYKDLSARLLDIQDGDVTFIQGNSLWLQSEVDLKPAFEQLNQVYYGAGINRVDLQDSTTVTAINHWPAAYTWSHVMALSPPIDANTKLIAASAAGFQASFTTAFNSSNTSLQPFTLTNGSTMSVASMFETNLPFSHYSDNLVQIADLPYGNSEAYALTIIIPQSGVTMQQLLTSFTNEKWSLWMSSLDSTNTYMLRLPKVELSNPVSIATALSSVGMSSALNTNSSYTNLTGNGIKPDAVLQGCYFKVHEDGLHAAPSVSTVTPPANRTPIYANKPYLMAVREKATGAILMLAEINNPTLH